MAGVFQGMSNSGAPVVHARKCLSKVLGYPNKVLTIVVQMFLIGSRWCKVVFSNLMKAKILPNSSTEWTEFKCGKNQVSFEISNGCTYIGSLAWIDKGCSIQSFWQRISGIANWMDCYPGYMVVWLWFTWTKHVCICCMNIHIYSIDII